MHGDTRLTNGNAEHEGRVEMCSAQYMWGTICNRQWTEANSNVVCHSLGYGGGIIITVF